MTYQYLLDTNILSDLVKHPQGRVFQQIVRIGEDGVIYGSPIGWQPLTMTPLELRQKGHRVFSPVFLPSFNLRFLTSYDSPHF